MSLDIMCNGHRFVKSTLFQSPGYLADLSPYITAVISSRLFATPIQLTASAIKPLAPLAQSILPTRATNFILNGTLTCEYCLHQVKQDSFDDGRICPALLLERLGLADSDFVLADQLIEAQDRARVIKEQKNLAEISDESRLEVALESSRSDSSSSAQKYYNPTNLNQEHNLPELPFEFEGSSEGRTEIGSLKHQLSEAHSLKDDLLVTRICPEIGLHAQAFTCIDCDKEIDLNSARLCYYDGRYYCQRCHTGSDLLPIPALILRNWDFSPKPVSKTSVQKICFLRTKPVLFNLFQMNSMLYGFIERLVDIKHTRERIQSMLKYLEVCGQPDKPHLIPVPRHFLKGEHLNLFTLNDLMDINQVYDLLSQLQSSLETHIVIKCESCRGKGFYCELCKDPHDVLFPFSKNAISCSSCQTVYHKNCFHRKKKNCPRCVRIGAKRLSLSAGNSSSGSIEVTANEASSSEKEEEETPVAI